MNNLPYLEPEHELSLNLGVLLIIIEALAITRNKKRVLTKDKIQIFYYLILKPLVLNKALLVAGKKEVVLDVSEFYTVSAESVNLDSLYDRNKVDILIRILASMNFLKISYCSKLGFLFELNENGINRAAELHENYYNLLRKYAKQLKLLQSASINNLNKYINTPMEG